MKNGWNEGKKEREIERNSGRKKRLRVGRKIEKRMKNGKDIRKERPKENKKKGMEKGKWKKWRNESKKYDINEATEEWGEWQDEGRREQRKTKQKWNFEEN